MLERDRHLASPLFTLELDVINNCFWDQLCNPAHTRTPRLYYCGTPQDRNERGGEGGEGSGRGVPGLVKNYSEQHCSKRLHKQRRNN